MSVLRTYTVLLLAGSLLVMTLLVTPAFARQGAAKPAPPKAQARPQAQAGRGGNAQAKAGNPAGEQLLDQLSRMTPAQREQALSRLPPARRQQLEQRIRNFQKLPPAAQTRTLNRLERLNSLPPQRQNQVRRSMNQFNALPEDRKMAINQELQHMSAMPDDDRRAYMNTEEFRNRYSPTEQQMMGNLAEVLPARE